MSFSVADKVLIASTLFLGAVAIFGPAFADAFKAWWLRPRLRFEFRLSPPDCHQTSAMLVLTPSQKSKEPIFYYRFRVSNAGKSQARRCEAVVEGLAIADGAGDYRPYPRYTPVRLIWGAGFNDFVDINPGRYFFCDFLTIPNAKSQTVARDLFGAYVDPPDTPVFDLGVVLNVKAAFFAQPNRLPPGKYRLDLAVYSENADTLCQSLYVAWRGSWKETEEAMFQECVVGTRAA